MSSVSRSVGRPVSRSVLAGQLNNLASIIKSLFASNEQGFAYDPNDLTTLYQDAAGTIPVTSAGQTVGLMRDKSGRGNHAFQTISASRPILQRNATTGAYYLVFDGVDDFLQTNNIDFTVTDKVSLFAGVRKLSDAARSMLVEFGLAATTNIFRLEAPVVAGLANYTFVSAGSSPSSAVYTNSIVAAPVSNVITAQGEIVGNLSSLRVDGSQKTSATASQGTGSYGNYPLYIGRRAGTSLPFNGHLYSLIGIGRLTTDSETTTLEKSIAKNTGVTLNV